MTDQSICLSTRFLPLFKGLCYAFLVAFFALSVPALLEGDWQALLILLSSGTMIIATLRGMRRLRTVVWEDNQLRVKDQQTILLLPEEINNIELKTLIGVHEVTLHEPHPYLGESFLFQASMLYFLRHNKIDEQMHELRQHIAQSKREMPTEGVAATRRPAVPPQLGGA
jgi:hypothetical protein